MEVAGRRTRFADLYLGQLMGTSAGKQVNALAETLAERLGYRFSDTDLLDRALTHASARAQHGFDYERLEFLGDRVLGLAVAELLFELFPDADEGELSVRLNALVNAQTLSVIGGDIGLDGIIRTGSDVKSTRGRKGTNLRADALEALIAAIYIEGGLAAVRPVIQRHWKPLAEAAGPARRDAKTELQEWAHRNGAKAPEYDVIRREGPDHEPLFTVTVIAEGAEPATARGRSKREAEQAAAEQILLRENVWNADRNENG